uniref:Terpene synthase N-terminal domain-containing protein n=1 Tax=Oryza glumipatula TaxID=40148 RepID=A0A0D9Z7N9_9ORYZ
MRERVDQLKSQVRCKLSKAKSMAYTVMLVDVLERLHIDDHFRNEITEALQHVLLLHHEEHDDSVAAVDLLHLESLRFRLLRQHGLWVSVDVFDKFKDSTGCFRESLSTDARGLLSLYNAAHLAMPGEEVALDDTIAFSRRSLKSLQGKLGSPMAEQVSRALDIPLPRTPKLLETMRYITEYEQEDAHDGVVLELARLDFKLIRSLYLNELKTLSLWWRQLYDSVKLSYARDRLVESYFWSCAIFHGEKYSRSRIIFTKVWDKSAVSILPEYLRIFYIKLLNDFDEMEDSLEPDEKYRMSYAKTTFKQMSEYYLREAQWSSDKYMPSFTEHLDISLMSSGFPAMAPVRLLGVRDRGSCGGAAAATKEAFEWATSVPVPALVRAGGELARFLNDVASYRIGKSGGDMASTVECYMAERGVGGGEAVAAVAALAERAWRTINGECAVVGTMDAALLPAARLMVNLARTVEVIYLGGRDGYTVGGDLKGLVTNLFLDPLPVY